VGAFPRLRVVGDAGELATQLGTARRFLAGGQRLGAVAAPVPLWRHPGGHLGRSLPVALRNSASAAAPRRWCSSGVMSGRSANRFPRLLMVTIAGTFSAIAFRFRGGRL
jgi:hypothetical protein